MREIALQAEDVMNLHIDVLHINDKSLCVPWPEGPHHHHAQEAECHGRQAAVEDLAHCEQVRWEHASGLACVHSGHHLPAHKRGVRWHLPVRDLLNQGSEKIYIKLDDLDIFNIPHVTPPPPHQSQSCRNEFHTS